METSGATVVVIDDDPSVRRALVRLLHSAGLQAEDFDSATAFLQRAGLDDVAGVLLDVCMPGMDGLALQHTLEQRRPDLPIIFLTGQGDIPTGVTAMKHGAVDFLLKPFDSASLLVSVDDALIRHADTVEKIHELDDIEMRLMRLSPREREVLEQVLTGRLNKQIAGELGIAEKTVKVHRGRVMTKMQVRSVAQLVQQCERVGVHPPSPCPI